MSDAAAPSAAPPKRLIITKMRMENFKSYYGVQEVGPFHKVRAQATHKILELPIPLSLLPSRALPPPHCLSLQCTLHMLHVRGAGCWRAAEGGGRKHSPVVSALTSFAIVPPSCRPPPAAIDWPCGERKGSPAEERRRAPWLPSLRCPRSTSPRFPHRLPPRPVLLVRGGAQRQRQVQRD